LQKWQKTSKSKRRRKRYQAMFPWFQLDLKLFPRSPVKSLRKEPININSTLINKKELTLEQDRKNESALKSEL
jgi:hypothetical protein